MDRLGRSVGAEFGGRGLGGGGRSQEVVFVLGW